MHKIHVTQQFLDASGPYGHFFEKKKKSIFSYGLGECVYQISGLHRFSFGQGTRDETTHTHTHTSIRVKTKISLTACSLTVDFGKF